MVEMKFQAAHLVTSTFFSIASLHLVDDFSFDLLTCGVSEERGTFLLHGLSVFLDCSLV